jgi:hypothetical protein
MSQATASHISLQDEAAEAIRQSLRATREARIRSVVRDELARHAHVINSGSTWSTANVTQVQSFTLDARSPLERTLDQLLAACQDLANAATSLHAAWTEPLA